MRIYPAIDIFKSGMRREELLLAPEDLLDRALELAGQIARFPLLAVELTKRALHVNTDASDLAAAMELENRNQVLAHGTAESAARRATWDR